MEKSEPRESRLTATWGLKDAAAYLHVHPDTCRKLAKDRTIPGAKIGEGVSDGRKRRPEAARVTRAPIVGATSRYPQ
jgi:excisionase family DNA binding protein